MTYYNRKTQLQVKHCFYIFIIFLLAVPALGIPSPTLVTHANYNSNESVNVTWLPEAGAVSYDVRVSSSALMGNNILNETVSTNISSNFTVDPLVSYQYFWSVRQWDGVEFSGWSNGTFYSNVKYLYIWKVSGYGNVSVFKNSILQNPYDVPPGSLGRYGFSNSDEISILATNNTEDPSTNYIWNFSKECDAEACSGLVNYTNPMNFTANLSVWVENYYYFFTQDPRLPFVLNIYKKAGAGGMSVYTNSTYYNYTSSQLSGGQSINFVRVLWSYIYDFIGEYNAGTNWTFDKACLDDYCNQSITNDPDTGLFNISLQNLLLYFMPEISVSVNLTNASLSHGNNYNVQASGLELWDYTYVNSSTNHSTLTGNTLEIPFVNEPVAGNYCLAANDAVNRSLPTSLSRFSANARFNVSTNAIQFGDEMVLFMASDTVAWTGNEFGIRVSNSEGKMYGYVQDGRMDGYINKSSPAIVANGTCQWYNQTVANGTITKFVNVLLSDNLSYINQSHQYVVVKNGNNYTWGIDDVIVANLTVETSQPTEFDFIATAHRWENGWNSSGLGLTLYPSLNNPIFSSVYFYNDTNINIRWNHVTDAQNYTYQISNDMFFRSGVTEGTTTNTNIDVSLPNYFRIKAYNNTYVYPYSAWTEILDYTSLQSPASTQTPSSSTSSSDGWGYIPSETPTREDKKYETQFHLGGEDYSSRHRITLNGAAEHGIQAANLYLTQPYYGTFTLILTTHSEFTPELPGAYQYFSLSQPSSEPALAFTEKSNIEISTKYGIEVYRLSGNEWQKLPGQLSGEIYTAQITSLGTFAIVRTAAYAALMMQDAQPTLNIESLVEKNKETVAVGGAVSMIVIMWVVSRSTRKPKKKKYAYRS